MCLKDFHKVWEKYDYVYNPVYNETNTVLVDDLLVKAFVNPPNTALFPTNPIILLFHAKKMFFFVKYTLPVSIQTIIRDKCTQLSIRDHSQVVINGVIKRYDG